MMAAQTEVRSDIVIPGVARRRLIRPEDATLFTMPASAFYIDADDQFYDPAKNTGREWINDQDWVANETTSTLSVTTEAMWNGAKVFKFGTGAHFMRLRRTPNLRSYLLALSISFPQSVIDALNAGTLGTKFVWYVQDEKSPSLASIASLALFTSATLKGWQFVAKYGINGNGFNIPFNQFPRLMPVTDTPQIIVIEYDYLAQTAKFYVDDGTVPVATKNKVIGDMGYGDGRHWIGSFGPLAGNSNSLQGDIGKVYMHDNTDPTRMYSAAQRAGLVNDWKTKYAKAA